jgi:hypothetical protein
MKYPNIHVQLVGQDGNAFAILGRVRAALRSAQVPDHQITEFTHEAMECHSYFALLNTCMEWVDCDGNDDPTGGGLAA